MRSPIGGCVAKRRSIDAGLQRVGDPQMRHRRVLSLHRTPVGLELREGPRQRLGVTRRHGARGVGEVLALARHRELHEAGDERRDEHRDEPEDQDDRVAVVVVATEEGHAHEHVRDESDGNHEAEDDHRQADVVVANMAELVRHDALELGVVHDLEQAGGRRDDGVLRIAPRGEGVGGRVGDHEDPRHRRARGDREVLDRSPQPRVVGLRAQLDRARHRQRLLVGGEVLEHRVRRGDDERDDRRS